MTNREFYTNIANGTVTEAEIAFASAAIEKMDAANEKRKNKPSKTALENAPLVEKIIAEIVGTEPVTAAQVGETLGVTTNKASALLRAAVATGKVASIDVKVPGKGACKGYILVVTE